MTISTTWNLKSLFILLLILNYSGVVQAGTPEEAAVVHLIKMCDMSFQLPNGHTSACPDDVLNIVLDENCNANIVQKLYVASLSDTPVDGQYYTIPSSYPSIYIEYSLNGQSAVISGPYESFKYIAAQQQTSRPVFVAETLIPISSSFAGCNTSAGYDLQSIEVKVVERVSSSSYPLYPIHDFSGEDEIFACIVFEETCNDCTGNPSCDPNANDQPVYEEELCIECGECSSSHRNFVGTGNVLSPDFRAKISPNPFQNMVLLEVATPTSGDLNLRIFDAQGKLMQDKQLFMNKGLLSRSIDTSDFLPGIYYFQINNGTEVKTLKMVKMKE